MNASVKQRDMGPVCAIPRCTWRGHIQCEDCGGWVCAIHHARLSGVRREHRKTDRTLCRDCADSYEQCPVCRFQIAPDDLVSTGEQDSDGYEIYVCGDCFDAAESRRTARYDAAMDRAAEREGRWYDTTFAGAFPDDERSVMEPQPEWVLIGNRYLNLAHIAEAVVSCWDLTMRIDVVMANGSPTFSLTGDDAVALAESLHRRPYSDWTVWIISRNAQQVAFIRTWKDCGLAEVATLRNLACVATARQLSSNWIILERKSHYSWQEVKAAVSVACPAVQSSRVTAANVSMEPCGGKS